jgi:hypothetical protein
MTRIEGRVGIGPGWPPSRSKRPVFVSVRYPYRTTIGEVVVEPVYDDVRVTGAGKFAIDDVQPGYIWVRIQHGSYVANRVLEVPDAATADYATLVEVDPSTLDPLPDLPSSAELLAEVDAGLAATIQGGTVTDGHLILTRGNGTTIDAGQVAGADGTDGDDGTDADYGIVEDMIDTRVGHTDDIERTVRRLDANSAATNSSGRFTFALFRARRTRTITTTRLIGITAGSGITRLKVGLFTVDGAGLLTQVGITANDTAVTAHAAYTAPLTTPYQITEGEWYAIGVEVAATSAPTFAAAVLQTGIVNGLEPVLAGITLANSDMPATVARAAYAGSTSAVLYAEAF